MIKKFLYVFFKTEVDKKRSIVRLMLQIIIALFTLNLVVASTLSLFSFDKLYSETGLDKGTYYNPTYSIYQGSELSSSKMIREGIQKLENDFYILEKDSAYVFSSNSSDIELQMLLSNNILRFKLPIAKGKWFDNYNDINNVDNVPAIVSNDISNKYELGEIYNITITKFTSDATYSKKISIEIIGFLDQSNYSYSLSGNSLINIIKNDFSGIIIPYVNIDNDYDEAFVSSSIFLSKDKNNSFSTKETIEKYLGNYGRAYEIESMIEDYKVGRKDITFFFGMIGIITLILTIAGLGGANMLSLIRRQKEYSIYYMCGMKWRTSLLMVITNNMIIFIVPIIISLILMKILFNSFFGDFIIIDTVYILITAFVGITIFLISSIEPLLKLKKYNPIIFIRSCKK